LNANFRKKAKIIKQKVIADAGICKFMLGDSVKIIDVPVKNNISNIKVDIFRSIGIVSEAEGGLGDGECGEGGHGEDGCVLVGGYDFGFDLFTGLARRCIAEIFLVGRKYAKERIRTTQNVTIVEYIVISAVL
jgi:hypothetical protein